MNNDPKKKDERDITSNADLDTDVVMPMEPATGAAENTGPSEGEELPDVEDHYVEENMFPSEPSDKAGD